MEVYYIKYYMNNNTREIRETNMIAKSKEHAYNSLGMLRESKHPTIDFTVIEIRKICDYTYND